MPRPPKNGWSKDKRYFNGKPIAHWEEQAKKLVVDHLIRGSFQYADKYSLPRELASRRLMDMALATSNVRTAEVLTERQAFQTGMAMALANMLLPDKPRNAKRRSKKA